MKMKPNGKSQPRQMKLICERDTKEISELESRLIEFYNSSCTYTAFAQTSDYPTLWQETLSRAEGIVRSRGICNILEIGAGRSGFGSFLRRKAPGNAIHLTSQDITGTNIDHLRSTSDAVITENVNHLNGCWDIIFHSYVYEHLCRPNEFNEILWRVLAPEGYLLIQCPRYDVPFYLPPCLDHLSAASKAWMAWQISVRHVVSMVNGKPQFTIFSDPAVFYMPFLIDRDVVHLVR
jgi:hypothetical protein